MPVSPTRCLGTVAALLAAGALAACGGSNDSSTTTTSGAAPAATAPQGSASTRLALAAEESGGLSFDRRSLSASAGDVTIAFDNPSGNSLPHAVAIEGGGVERTSATIEPGSTSTVTANLRPGTYTFYCPVDGHRQQGMEGTLTVR